MLQYLALDPTKQYGQYADEQGQGPIKPSESSADRKDMILQLREHQVSEIPS